jgi:hypothetical protein
LLIFLFWKKEKENEKGKGKEANNFSRFPSQQVASKVKGTLPRARQTCTLAVCGL